MFLLTIIPDSVSDKALKNTQLNLVSDKQDEVEELDKALLGKSNCKNGDLNDDGKIDQDDIKILEDYLNGKKDLTENQRKCSDLNKDGVIDEKDLKILYLFTQRRELEDRVRDLQDLYSALVGQQTPGHTVLGVDNGNMELVKAELDSATALLAILNNSIS